MRINSCISISKIFAPFVAERGVIWNQEIENGRFIDIKLANNFIACFDRNFFYNFACQNIN